MSSLGELEDEKWHEGEKEMQRRVLGSENAASHQAEVGDYLRRFLPFQHRDFYAALPYLFVGYVDGAGYPWATVISHHEQRVFHSFDSTLSEEPEESTYFDAKGTRFALLLAGFHPGERSFHELRAEQSDLEVGVLGLDLSNRRRNRVNGSICARPTEEGMLLGRVGLSFGNCPKYIQQRPWKVLDRATATSSDRLEARARSAQLSLDSGPLSATAQQQLESFVNIVAKADTLFIATAHIAVSETRRARGPGGVDISHRGGPTGFVETTRHGETEGELELRWADYVGNAFFNTLGNIVSNSKAGLCFPDFATGDLWQAVGHARINFTDKSLPGAERTVSFQVRQIRHLPRAFAVRFKPEPLEFSPFLPEPAAEELLRCSAIKTLTPDTHTFSFVLKRPRIYIPGQYGIFLVRQPNGERVQRVWTISSTPQNAPYGESSISITVKQKPGGRVTPYLQAWLAADPHSLSLVGNFQGEFSIFYDPLAASGGLPSSLQDKHILFVAAGSGITPIISQLRMLFQMRTQFPSLRVSVLSYFRSPLESLFLNEFQLIQKNWSNFFWFQSFTLSSSLPSSSSSSLSSPLSSPLSSSSSSSSSIPSDTTPSYLNDLKERFEGRPKAEHLMKIQSVVQTGPEMVLVCGPEGFMETITNLVQGNWPTATLKKESFAF